jgi:hypothetical protein
MRADGCCACNCLYYLGSEDTIISSTICNCLYYLGPRTGLQEIEDAEACVKICPVGSLVRRFVDTWFCLAFSLA